MYCVGLLLQYMSCVGATIVVHVLCVGRATISVHVLCVGASIAECMDIVLLCCVTSVL